jgi:hypothetical protein
VPKPAWLDRYLWFDLSPMRPDEYGRTEAYRWVEAVQIRNAYQAGIDDADDEVKGKQRIDEWKKEQGIGQIG